MKNSLTDLSKFSNPHSESLTSANHHLLPALIRTDNKTITGYPYFAGVMGNPIPVEIPVYRLKIGIIKKVMLLLIAFVMAGGMVVGQNNVYWRNDVISSGSWEFGTTCESWGGDGVWSYASPYNGNRKRPDCYGNHDIYFDGNGNPNMNLNSLNDFGVRRIFFTINATSARTLNTNASRTLYLNANNGDPKIENNSTAAHTFNVPIFLNNWAQFNPVSGDLSFSGTINNNGNNIDVYGENSKMLTFSGAISGTGKLILDQYSKVKLSTTNLYTGNTEINKGELWIGTSGDAIASGSAIYLGNGGQTTNIAKIFLSKSDGGATFSRTINISNGNASTRFLGGVNASGTNTFSAGIAISATKPLNLEAVNSGGTTEFTGVISGDGGTVTTLGAGTIKLSNTNTYSGGTTIAAGTLSIASNNALGTGSLVIGNSITTSTLDVTATTTRTQGISITDASTAGVINVASGQIFTLSGGLTNTGSTNTTKFGKSGPGTFKVSGASTYAGQIQIGDGVVIVENSSGLGDNVSTTARGIDLGLNVGDVSTSNNVVLQATNGITVPQSIYVAPNTSNATRTIGLSGSGSATFSNEIYLDGNLTLSGGTGTVTFSGNIIKNVEAGGQGLIVAGGTVVLSGVNTYNGTTTISSGTLEIQGDLASSLITVASGAKLRINGSNVDINALSINSGGIVEILAGKSLTVTGTLINNATSSGLVIKSDATGTGSLIEHSGVAATVQRYIMNDFKWHFLSSPVSSQAIWSAFAPTPTGTPLIFAGGPTYGWDFYYYNPNVPSSGLYWVNLRKTGGAYNNGTVDAASDAAGFGTTTPPTFTVGKGYLVAYNTTPFTATHTFSGTLNMGPVSKTIVSSPNAYNLVGNPYPSSIDWKSASWGTGRDALFNNSGYDYWIWNENPTVGNYAVFNSSGSGSVNGASQYIAPSQAFFVKAASGGTFGMNDAIRVHSNQPFLKNANSETNFVRLKIENTANTYSDEMIVEFNPDFTGGGSEKFWSFYAESPELYSVKDGNNYSIDRYTELLADMKVNIAAKTGVAATYTITAGNISDFTLSDRVYLLDKKTGVKTNLKQTPSYSFAGTPDDDRNRFQLIFGAPIGTDETMAAAFAVFSSENSIFVRHNNAHTAYSVLVTNMLGQIITRVKLTGNDLKRIDEKFVPGVYIVTLYSGGNMFSEKVVVM